MDKKTKSFYDEFWPKNVPYYEHTKKYMVETISEKRVHNALDAGCGHGVCSVVLSEISDKVTAVDLSDACLSTAQNIANKFGRNNIQFKHEDLQELSLENDSFDLIWCWGVAMMAPKPDLIFNNLFRVLKPGGTLYLGIYLKTWLSPVHQVLRHFLRTFFSSGKRKTFVLNFFAVLTRVIVKISGKEINLRADNVSIQAQVDDWYYPPFKTFYTPTEIINKMKKFNIKGDLVQSQVGRMKSATIFVVKGTKAN